MVITRYNNDYIYLSLMDKRDHSYFFVYDYVPTFEVFFNKMDKYARTVHTSSNDYVVLLTDLNKIVRDQNIKLVLDGE